MSQSFLEFLRIVVEQRPQIMEVRRNDDDFYAKRKVCQAWGVIFVIS